MGNREIIQVTGLVTATVVMLIMVLGIIWQIAFEVSGDRMIAGATLLIVSVLLIVFNPRSRS